MPVNLQIPSLGDKFQDYRDDIPGNSYTWGPDIYTNEIRNFTFHHSVTPQVAKNDGDWKGECDNIANLHMFSNRWKGVGYRFIICSDGTVAYVGDLSHGGSAVGGMNNVMFSACFIGDFTKELPTAMQVHSAHLLAKHFLTEMPQYPNLFSWDQVAGHKSFNATICPSPAWMTGDDTLRSRIVRDWWVGYPDPSPPEEPEPEPELGYIDDDEEISPEPPVMLDPVFPILPDDDEVIIPEPTPPPAKFPNWFVRFLNWLLNKLN